VDRTFLYRHRDLLAQIRVPAGTDALNQVEERDSELTAARTANHELMTQLNGTRRHLT
jgi:hypothetical protein